ncbi:MAG TPA: amidase family protein [Chondromyces sp.]|nr:amidase family protein [Chondromyces sp.]
MKLKSKVTTNKMVKLFATASIVSSIAFTSAIPLANATSANVPGKSPVKPFILEEATIEDMQKALQTGKITSTQLVQMYIDRINHLDKGKINSVLEINPDALEIAEELDKNRKGKGNVGPLYGIPVIVKDNIDTADKMHTSAGSLALKDNIAAEDSFVAERLREEGAIILGKANMTEWANFMSYNMPSGYSSRGGQVLNPYGKEFAVGGSSAGTGASVASNFAAVGIGTETSGSILSPSVNNSLVGIKPTVGLVSRSGIIPLAHSQDTAGPMARTVADAAALLGTITGVDEKDPITKESTGKVPEDYTKFLKKNGLKGERVGIDTRYLKNVPAQEAEIIQEALEDMEEQGATIVDTATIPSKDELANFSSSVLAYEFKGDINAYLGKLPDNIPVHSLAELIQYNSDNADTMLKYGQQRQIDSQALSGNLTDSTYLEHRAKDLRLSREEGIDYALEAYDLDAIIFPNTTGAAIAAKAGYPSVTVPAGYTTAGKPVGVTFTSTAYSEPKLIELAYSYEQATEHRVSPVLDIK